MIYLDIDDVMLTRADKAKDATNAPKHRLAALFQIIRYTKAPVVLSSDWRKGDAGKQFLRAHNLWQHSQPILGGVAWHTPLHLSDLDDDLSVRGQYIDAHMKAHGIWRYLIIDDSPVLPTQGPGYLAIDPDVGLMGPDFDRARWLWDAQA